MATSVSGRLTEIIFARLDAHADLRQELIKVIKEKGIRSGLVLSITGALERATLQHFGSIGPPATPIELLDIPGPLEASGHGIIGLVEAPRFGKSAFGLGDDFIHGDPYIHVHLTVQSAEQTICGHLMDGCTVRSNFPVSHFTMVLGRIEGALVKMLGEPGDTPGSFIIGHELVQL